MNTNEKLTLTIPEVQKLTGWGRDHAHTLIKTGVLKNVGTQRRFLIARTALERFLVEGKK